MKENIQKFGRFLSAMVMPNIGAFIAWGLITSFFIATGWAPNAQLANIVGPMLTYMIPLLIGYTGGYLVYKRRGAVIAAVGCFGVITGASMTMILGCMAMGPLCAWILKVFDSKFQNKVHAGFEMLYDNFSLGIIGFLMACFGNLIINPATLAIMGAFQSGVQVLVDNDLLPLTSIIVEPAKVLFLNNAVNHGIFTPMGTQQALETGKSIFFLIEANPGPGLGLLLVDCFVGKGAARSSAPGAILIHFLGGIHEIYFPYVLINPLTIFGMIAGGATGVATNVLFNSGLVAPASPGSILAVLSMTERGSYVGVILSVILAAAVSCVVNSFIIKFSQKDSDDLEEATAKVADMKNEAKGIVNEAVRTTITKIVFACDAGMGSSAMGATTLTKKLKDAGIDLKVNHVALNEIPEDTQVVVTQESLVGRAKDRVPNARIFPIKNFMGGNEYDLIVEEIKKM